MAAAEVLTAAPTEAIEVPTVEVSQVNETVS